MGKHLSKMGRPVDARARGGDGRRGGGTAKTIARRQPIARMRRMTAAMGRPTTL